MDLSPVEQGIVAKSRDPDEISAQLGQLFRKINVTASNPVSTMAPETVLSHVPVANSSMSVCSLDFGF